MTSLYLVSKEDGGNEKCKLYTVHYSGQLMSEHQKEGTALDLVAGKDSSVQDRNIILRVSNAAGDTFRVALPPNLLELVIQLPISTPTQSRKLRFVRAGNSRAPPLLHSLHSHRIEKSEQGFRLFGRLPQEIRDMVWRETINTVGPRLVQVWHDIKLEIIRSNTSVPVQLRICRESRLVGLQYYQRIFSTGTTDGGVYANLRDDWIYLSPGFYAVLYPQLFLHRFMDAVLNEEREAIQNLAIDFYRHRSLKWENLSRLTALKQVALIQSTPPDFDYGPEKLPRLCRTSTENLWRKREAQSLRDLAPLLEEWEMHRREIDGTWKPPAMMQWYLHVAERHANASTSKVNRPVTLASADDG